MKLLIILCSLLLIACDPPKPPPVAKQQDGTTAFTGNAMTMQYKILIGQDLAQTQADQVTKIINTTFHDTDTIFNKWNPHSELSKLNHQKAGLSTPLSPELLRLFKETDRIVLLSEGRFDPTIEPLQDLWKRKLQAGKTPSDAEILEIAPAIGWDKISFNDGLFMKENDRTKMDFGGIAKGLCIDMIAERLHEAGFLDVYVEWGGEIRTIGSHPQGRPWTVFISRLNDVEPDHAVATLHLNDQAIATSGDYLQNWTIGQSTYFHIFNPKTLKPLESTHASVASASVVSASCAFADGLATVAMMFPNVAEAKQWAEKIQEEFPETSFWIVSRQHKL